MLLNIALWVANTIEKATLIFGVRLENNKLEKTEEGNINR